MNRLASPAALAAGCAVVLAVNLVMLGSAAWNRSGEPACELALTERELEMPERGASDDSGLALSLRLTTDTPRWYWRLEPRLRWDAPPVDLDWLDRDRLAALGFDLSVGPDEPGAGEHYDGEGVRRVFLALEMEGEGWRRWLERREAAVAKLRADAATGGDALRDAEALLALDRTMRSRLFPVDAGLDEEALRGRYPDRRRFAIVEGGILARIRRRDGGAPALSGQIVGPLVSEIHVPPEMRGGIAPVLAAAASTPAPAPGERSGRWPEPRAPRYHASLAYGRGGSPWLRALAAD